ASRLAGRGRSQLLPDHAQRQELVALEAQDRTQGLHRVLVEEAVAAPRPLRREQTLLLEVADLRDRDVGKLVAQLTADRSDVLEPVSRRSLGRRGPERKVGLYLPICSSSPSSSGPDSMRRRLRKVPFRLPLSSMKNWPSLRTTSAWRRET